MATRTRMTVEDYYALTSEGDRTQLVDGELVVNDPTPVHALVQGRLYAALFNWASAEEGRGLVLLPTDVVIGEHNVFGPDIVYVAERNRPTDLHARLERIPDLCVEVRSPGTWRYDVGAKKSAYEAGGLPELWLVDDRAQEVLVFRRSTPGEPTFDVSLELARGDTLASPHLPGFGLALAALFGGL